MVENIAAYKEIAPARLRSVKGESLTVREYMYWMRRWGSSRSLLVSVRTVGVGTNPLIF
jgi:hypothetical protein